MLPSYQMDCKVQLRTGDTSSAQVILKHGQDVERGIDAASKYVLLESLNIVPVENGDLARSGFQRKEGSGFRTVGIAGYGTPYAVYVHEDLEAAHGEMFNSKYAADIINGEETSRRPQERSKFLEWVIENRQEEISNIVELEARTPGAGMAYLNQAATGIALDLNSGAINPFRLRK